MAKHFFLVKKTVEFSLRKKYFTFRIIQPKVVRRQKSLEIILDIKRKKEIHLKVNDKFWVNTEKIFLIFIL